MSDIFSLIVSVLFYIIIATLSLLSVLGIFIVVKYGRSPVVTLFSSLVYAGLFSLVLLGAYLTLQQL